MLPALALVFVFVVLPAALCYKLTIAKRNGY